MKLKRETACSAVCALTVILFCLPGISLAQSNNPHAASLYNLGLTAYKQGSPESAVIFFKRACDLDPDLADAQYNLGVIFQSQRRLKEAVPRFQEVLRVKPNDADAHYQLGLCYADLGQPADARRELTCIAPNNAHFTDAQKRLSLLDTGTKAPIGEENQSVNLQPAGLAPPVEATAPAIVTTATTATLASQAQLPEIFTSSGTVNGNASPGAQAQAQTQPPTTIASAPPLTPVPTSHAALSEPTRLAQPQTMPSPAISSNNSTVNAIANTPPFPGVSLPIISDTTVRVIANGFNAPAGIAFDRQGNLYVANYLTNTIDRINTDGSRAPFSMGSNLKGPIGMIIDNANNIYVANYLGGTIVRINPSGVSTIVASGFKKPYYLTLNKDGNLFVSQQEDNSIVQVTLPKTNPM